MLASAALITVMDIKGLLIHFITAKLRGAYGGIGGQSVILFRRDSRGPFSPSPVLTSRRRNA